MIDSRKNRSLRLAGAVAALALIGFAPSADARKHNHFDGPKHGENAVGCTNPVFQDQFDQSQIDTSAWNVFSTPLQADPTKGQQAYVPSAVHTGNGLRLVMTSDPTSQYLSGRIASKRTFQYGRIEFVAKLPRGRGLWPALWLRTPPSLPFDGEIDLVEGFGSSPGTFQSTLHPWHNGKEPRNFCGVLHTDNDTSVTRAACDDLHFPGRLGHSLTETFHTYAVDWTPNKVTWSLDGVPYFSTTEMIPSAPMALQIVLAISTRHDGAPDQSLRLPQELDVKSVKVCSLPGQ